METGLIERIAPLTKSANAPKRLRAMLDSLLSIDRNGIAGDVVECGIWQGGYLIMARLASPGRICWGYDTFTGMTAPGEFDVTRAGRKGVAGKSAVSLERVIDNCKRQGVYDTERLRFIVGPVEETLPQCKPKAIALLRLDTDWYSSTKAELEHLWPLLTRGGIMIVDDYGHWLGSRRAVLEFFDNDMPTFKMIDYTALLMVKP